jgi:uncharacterized protein YecE (DUF72 family)
MPQGHPTSIPPILTATSDLAVLRFHGHSERWTSNDVRERFAYLYDEDELRAWADRISALSEHTGTTHVVFNNCCADHSQQNAAQLAELLGEKRRASP